jgi:hypothetical protein
MANHAVHWLGIFSSGSKCGRDVCSLCRCGRGWYQWRTQGYSLNPSVVFNGKMLFSSDCGLAAGTCRLAKHQVGVDTRMLLFDVISVLVGATPFGTTINTRTRIVLCSIVSIDALRLCISFAAGFARVWAFEHFRHDSRSYRRPRRCLSALISYFLGLMGLASCSSLHEA